MNITEEALALIIKKVLQGVEEQLPEGVHTALRKVCNSTHAADAWQAVHAMSDREWKRACEWAIHPHTTIWLDHHVKELTAELEKSGFSFTKKEIANV